MVEQERLLRIVKTTTDVLSEQRATRQAIHRQHEKMMRALEDIAARQSEKKFLNGDSTKDLFRKWYQEFMASNTQDGALSSSR